VTTVYSAEEIAEVCHEANRGLQRVQLAHGNTGVPVAPSWEDFPAEQRDSVIQGVAGVLAGASPEESHEGWCELKRSTGWVHGPVKDTEARTHPCLVPYSELPADQQIKDHLFAAIVHALGQASADG
jgi:hypothetical protein